MGKPNGRVIAIIPAKDIHGLDQSGSKKFSDSLYTYIWNH